MRKPLTAENHGREEELHYNNLVTRSLMIWKEYTEFGFFKVRPPFLVGEDIYLFSTELLDWMPVIVGEICMFRTL